VLVARLLDLPGGPHAALPSEAIEKFKLNFNKTAELTETASHRAFEILQAASPNGRLAGAGLEVASRWVRSLCPLGLVLGARGLD
jgi:hypothetical protein